MQNPLFISINKAKLFLLDGCNIPDDFLDDKVNAQNEWHINKKSGPQGYIKDYISPLRWTGIGLKVANIYDNRDNTWIWTNNSPGEWILAIMELDQWIQFKK